MNIKITNYSTVIAGNSHNPTVVTDYFLLKSGIIEDVKEIDRNNFFVTPAASQALINVNSTVTVLVVEPGRLLINGPSLYNSCNFAQKYCAALPFIKTVGIGINFETLVTDFDARGWFSKNTPKVDYKGAMAGEIGLKFFAKDDVICSVAAILKDNDLQVAFNFHQSYSNVPLGEVNKDFQAEANEYLKQQEEFINLLLL